MLHKLTLILALVVFASVELKAHSWFPTECCGGDDCQEIVELLEVNGKWAISTKKQTAIVEKNFSIRPSQDTKQYICIANGKVYCIFMPSYH